MINVFITGPANNASASFEINGQAVTVGPMSLPGLKAKLNKELKILGGWSEATAASQPATASVSVAALAAAGVKPVAKAPEAAPVETAAKPAGEVKPISEKARNYVFAVVGAPVKEMADKAGLPPGQRNIIMAYAMVTFMGKMGVTPWQRDLVASEHFPKAEAWLAKRGWTCPEPTPYEKKAKTFNWD
jgi:hypothetical protein